MPVSGLELLFLCLLLVGRIEVGMVDELREQVRALGGEAGQEGKGERGE